MHPNGQIPAYEWAFGDVNPPVHAWAALKVFEIDGGRDYDFLARVMHKLLINFTWWVNRKDTDGNNVFEGGFLGLDNVGPFDRWPTAAGEPVRYCSLIMCRCSTRKMTSIGNIVSTVPAMTGPQLVRPDSRCSAAGSARPAAERPNRRRPSGTARGTRSTCQRS